MTTVLVSDLHLTPERPQITAIFFEFLDTRCTQAQALYILGDLFEHWVGDDIMDDPEVARVIQRLRRLHNHGVPIFFVRGNRDFLVGERFAAATGSRILEAESVATIQGRRTLIMHGDSLCTNDTDHQAWRNQVLSPTWQEDFLSRPLAERLNIARDLRRQSEARKKTRSAEAMDVNQQAVESALRRHGVDRLVHGHTHRPAVHKFMLDGRTAQRIVLGDWYTQGSVLVCEDRQWQLESLPVGAAAS